MFDQNKVIQEFIRREKEIKEDQEELENRDVDYPQLIRDLELMSEVEFRSLLGDEPLVEPIEFNQPFIRQICDCKSKEELNSWAIKTVKGACLSAVDGSQINPSKELSCVIGLVQAGYFGIEYPKTFDQEHPDAANIDYDVKPKLLIGRDGKVIPGSLSEGDVALYRQSMEIDYSKERIQAIKSNDLENLLLIDGTLIYSFMKSLNPITMRDMIDQLVTLLKESEESKVFLAGYIDTSYAKDLCTVLHALHKIEEVPFSDAGILKPFLAKMGSYTIPFIVRRDPMSEYGEYKNKMCFSYARINSKRPVRIEFPRWIWDMGFYEKFMALITGSAIFGAGYPHVLIRAHELAVLKGNSRELFKNLALYLLNDKMNLGIEEMVKQKLKHSFS